METSRRRFSLVALVGLLALLLGPMVALADVVVNDVQNNADNRSIELGQSTTVRYWLAVTDNATDPLNGCNVNAANPGTASFPSLPANVSAKFLDNLSTFTACDDPNTSDRREGSIRVEFTASGTGSFTIPDVVVTGGRQTSATYDARSTDFTLLVTQPTPSDSSAPTIRYTLNPAEADGANGWYTSNVSLTWTVTENESPNSLQKTGCVDQPITADQTAQTYSCSATSDGGSAGPENVTIKRDETKPVVTSNILGNPSASGWYTGNVAIEWGATDATSGIASKQDCGGADNQTQVNDEGANLSYKCIATDEAGHSDSKTETLKRDATAPTNIAFVGNISNGDTFYFGDVPAGPTCTADDATSGLKSCVVTGHSTAIGSRTLTATATDVAGNTDTKQISYEVLAWTLQGFYRPVDMSGTLNTVKAGSTVPLKFEVFKGTTELTDTAVIQGFSARKVNCSSLETTSTDPVEVTTTGGTSLRYDATDGQFIQNWKTPTETGCYKVSMETKDGSSVTTFFSLGRR